MIDIGINILDDIYNKCKGGYKLLENIKQKTIFKNKKEEAILSDLFQKIFEIDREKRLNIATLRDHPALKGKVTEEESTTE